jgi:cytochrome c oxidase subunit 3
MADIAVPTRAKIGMWLFLLTEFMLFGALFLLYAAYRHQFPAAFHEASLELNLAMGAANTAILLTSSLFVALSVHALQRQRAGRTRLFLAAALLLGAAFLGVKAAEWGEKIAHGIYPSSPVLLERSSAEILYFGLYFTMTGLHALHVIVGLGVLVGVLLMLRRGPGGNRLAVLDNAGLYWHMVDIIWIFLFPLYYLIR